MAGILYREKLLDPLKPALLLPEVTDPTKWKKGGLWFIDPEDKYVLRLFKPFSHQHEIRTARRDQIDPRPSESQMAR